MLNNIDLNEKTYDDLIAEALAKIPLYSKEWTNFNLSDPGVTVLQNLSAFSLLQQDSLSEFSEEVRRKLLALLGYRAQPNVAATLLLQTPAGTNTTLPPQYQLKVGDLCFETERPMILDPWQLAAVYVEREGLYQDISFLLNVKSSSASLFGADPKVGDSLCCILDQAPNTSHPLRIWAQIPADDQRSPFPGEGGPVFARTCWQYYTAQGWVDATAVDNTHGFLVSGEIVLQLDQGAPVPFDQTPTSGYALRCVLVESHYDCPPRLQALSANLFPVRQWQTRSLCCSFQGANSIHLSHPMAVDGNLFVYCQEAEGAPYRPYQVFTGAVSQGRLFFREELPDGVRLTFNPLRFGRGPWEGPDAVRIVCYDNEMVHHRSLGVVHGYDDQEVVLDLVENVLPERFSLIAEALDSQGNPECYFVTPEETDPEGLCYRVDHQQGKLHIIHPGLGTGYQLYLADCCVTQGALGNIPINSTLSHQSVILYGSATESYTNPSPALGGHSYESPEALRIRFSADTRKPTSAVLASDYEALVAETPGLSIHKVHAISSPQENLVRIAVKPHSTLQTPLLSPLYLQEIRSWLEPRRMLTTRVELLQPHYVAVDVRAVLYVKSHFGSVKPQLEELIRSALDYVHGSQPFGSRVQFNTIYQMLLALPYVEAVDELRLLPQERQGVTLEGPDLRLDERTLCYPGRIHLELHSRPANRSFSRRL